MNDVHRPLHPGLNLGPAHGEAHEDAEVIVFGFWVFLMTDLILFGLVFAIYGTMTGATAGGPGPQDFVDLNSVAAQTALLLASSFTFGLAALALKYGDGVRRILLWLGVTALLGAGFLALELRDFAHMAQMGAVPSRSGYLSAFYALVGLHGLHVSIGLVWIGVLALQLAVIGPTRKVKTRLVRLGLYWHFLDIIWIGIMSGVFLGGVA